MSNNLIPKSFNERMQYCEVLAKSNLVPKEFKGKKEDIFVAIEFGMMIGLNPMQSLTNISVINGRPSVWGDAALALVKASGKMEYIKEYFKDDETAVCETKRKDEPVAVVREFTMKDAERANLLIKDNWKKHPKRMLQLRARAWALRDAYPDVLSGIQIREEMEDAEVVEEAEKSVIDTKVDLAEQKKDEPFYKIVGNKLLEKYPDAVSAKQFVKQVLNLPADVELKGKYLQNLTEDELKILNDALEQNQTLQAE